MILPYSPRPHWLQSFGAVAGAGLILLGLAFWIAGWPGPALIALVPGLVLVVAGQVRPESLRLPYRAWNKAGREIAGLTSRLLLTLIFHVILRSVGRVGREQLVLETPPPGATMWMRYPTDGATGLVEASTGGWIRRFGRWATGSSARIWTLCLVPFLLILSRLEGDDAVASSISADTYTLY